MKINERTILGKGCRICEQEYLSVFPAFALSYYSHMKGLKIELGSDRVLGIPLDTYIPSEQVAIEVNSGSEDMEILKEHLCHQRGIKRIKLPMKTNETEIAYAQRIKAAFQALKLAPQASNVQYVRERGCFEVITTLKVSSLSLRRNGRPRMSS